MCNGVNLPTFVDTRCCGNWVLPVGLALLSSFLKCEQSAGHAANHLVGHLIKLGGHNELFMSVTIK